MRLKTSLLALQLCIFAVLYSTHLPASEKPVQHLQLPDVTSYEEAKQVFSEITRELRKKHKLDEAELHEIHMTTYSLEKAVAYFAENMKGDQQAAAKNIAEVVELVHIGSENNRASETEVYLKEYFKLAEKFSGGL
jgi:hypothetical protein